METFINLDFIGWYIDDIKYGLKGTQTEFRTQKSLGYS